MKKILITILIGLSQISFSQDSHTEITPTLHHDFNGSTLLYSPTFEISWYNLKQTLFGAEDIKIQQPPDYLDYLNDFKNGSDFNDLKQSLIFSGKVIPQIADSLNILRERDFPYIQRDFSNYLGSIISYALIDLRFNYQADFEFIHDPLIFDGNKVKSFGVKYNHRDNKEIGEQVSIIDYIDKDNFIVEIRLDDQDFELYLAKP